MRPYKFQLNLKSVLWGGDRIATFKGMHFDRSDVGESWEVSGIEGKESVVADGPDAGLNLRQLLEKYGSRIVGEHVYRRFGNELRKIERYDYDRRFAGRNAHSAR